MISPNFNTMDGIMRPMDPSSPGFVPVALSGDVSDPRACHMNTPHDSESLQGVSEAVNALSVFNLLFGG